MLKYAFITKRLTRGFIYTYSNGMHKVCFVYFFFTDLPYDVG